MSAHRYGWAGLAAGPGAWALGTQAGYALVPWACGRGVQPLPWLLGALALAALASGLWSWRVRRALPAAEHRARFVTAVAAGLGQLFALVLAVQAAAGLFLGPCEQ